MTFGGLSKKKPLVTPSPASGCSPFPIDGVAAVGAPQSWEQPLEQDAVEMAIDGPAVIGQADVD